MDNIGWLNILVSIVILYLLFSVKDQSTSDNKINWIVGLLLVLMILINGYKVMLHKNAKKEHFTEAGTPELVIDIADDSMKLVYDVVAGTKITWRNTSNNEYISIMGDVFGNAKVAPGDEFSFGYTCAGLYKFYLSDYSEPIHINVINPNSVAGFPDMRHSDAYDERDAKNTYICNDGDHCVRVLNPQHIN